MPEEVVEPTLTALWIRQQYLRLFISECELEEARDRVLQRHQGVGPVWTWLERPILLPLCGSHRSLSVHIAVEVHRNFHTFHG